MRRTCGFPAVRLTGWLGSGQQQQAASIGGQRADAPLEGLFDAPRPRENARKAEPARQLRGGQTPRQLQQRQRVASGLGDELLAHLRIDRPGQHRFQQRPRILPLQPLYRELGRSGQLPGWDPGREDEPHRLHAQPAGHEGQDLGRGLIQPLLVIHHTDQRPLLGGRRQLAQNRQADQEPVWHWTFVQRKSDPERLPLPRREPLPRDDADLGGITGMLEGTKRGVHGAGLTGAELPPAVVTGGSQHGEPGRVPGLLDPLGRQANVELPHDHRGAEGEAASGGSSAHCTAIAAGLSRPGLRWKPSEPSAYRPCSTLIGWNRASGRASGAACRADESLVARRMIETIGNDGQAGIAAAVVALA